MLIIEDDRYLPDSALEATQKLVEEDGVLAVIGSLGTVQHIAVAEYLNDPSRDDDSAAGVPDLFVSTGWSAWSNPLLYPWTVAFIPDHATDGRALAQYINRSAPGQSVGVIYQDDDFGAEYRAAVRRTLHPNSSFTARAYSLDDDGEVDVREQLESLQADGVQVVVLATTPGVTATAYLAAEDMDYDPKFLLSYVNAVSPLAGAIGGGTTSEAISRGLEALDGTVVNMYLMSTFAHESEPAMEEHRRIMTAHRGPPVSSLSVYGQALAETVVETLNRSCSLLTREAVREAASSLQDFRPSLMLDTLEIEVRPDDQRAIRALQPVRIESDGTLTLLGEPASGE